MKHRTKSKALEEAVRLKEELLSLDRSIDKRSKAMEAAFNKMAASSERINQNLMDANYYEKKTESIMSKWKK